MKGSQYLEIFRAEAAWHLQNLYDCTRILEKEPDNQTAVSGLFRTVHSLTGMAQTMGFFRMQSFAGGVESVLLEIQNGGGAVTGKTIDYLFECRDAFYRYLENIKNTSREGTDGNEVLLEELKESIRRKEAGQKPGYETTRPQVLTQGYTGRFSGIRFFREEVDAFRRARKDGCRIYGFWVMLNPDCLMKEARAALIFWRIRNFGEVLSCRPTYQKIKDGQFGHTFTFFLASKKPLEYMLAIAVG